jgi:hypothetical protein
MQRFYNLGLIEASREQFLSSKKGNSLITSLGSLRARMSFRRDNFFKSSKVNPKLASLIGVVVRITSDLVPGFVRVRLTSQECFLHE